MLIFFSFRLKFFDIPHLVAAPARLFRLMCSASIRYVISALRISQCRAYLPDLLNRGAAVGAGGLSNASSILVSLDGALLIANNHIYTTCSLARESKAKNRMGQQLDGSIGRWKVVLISSKIIFRYNKSINTGFKYIKLSPYLVSASVKSSDNNVCKGII